MHEHGLEEREPLIAYIESTLPHFNIRAFAETKLPPSAALTMESAWQLWNEAVASHQIAHLNAELLDLQQQELDEAGLTRMMEIQESIKKAQTARTFAPMSTDAA